MISVACDEFFLVFFLIFHCLGYTLKMLENTTQYGPIYFRKWQQPDKTNIKTKDKKYWKHVCKNNLWLFLAVGRKALYFGAILFHLLISFADGCDREWRRNRHSVQIWFWTCHRHQDERHREVARGQIQGHFDRGFGAPLQSIIGINKNLVPQKILSRALKQNTLNAIEILLKFKLEPAKYSNVLLNAS